MAPLLKGHTAGRGEAVLGISEGLVGAVGLTVAFADYYYRLIPQFLLITAQVPTFVQLVVVNIDNLASVPFVLKLHGLAGRD